MDRWRSAPPEFERDDSNAARSINRIVRGASSGGLLRGMDIQDLRIFARAAAVQNLSSVGQEFRLTPGTISKRLQALEEKLGVRLFDRTTRSIRITEEGALFLAHVERGLTEIAAAEEAVRSTSGEPAGLLRIAAPETIGPLCVPGLVADFLAAYPAVEIHAEFTDRKVHLQEDGFDLAIVRGTLRDSALKSRRLKDDELAVVAAPAYFTCRRRARPKKPEDLEAWDCLVHGEDWDWSFARRGRATTVRVSARLRSNSSDALRRAACAGLGIARLPLCDISGDLASGRLVRLFADYDVSGARAVWVVYAGGRHVPPRLRAFVDFLIDAMRQPAAPVAVEADAAETMSEPPAPATFQGRQRDLPVI